MPLLTDEPFDFLGYGRCTSRCRVRIFTPGNESGESGYVVMLVDDAGSSGTSVTNAAEQIAAQVCARHHVPPERAVFIEHYDFRHLPGGHDDLGRTETFARVAFAIPTEAGAKFDYIHGGSLGKPLWSHIDKESVEILIGEPLP